MAFFVLLLPFNAFKKDEIRRVGITIRIKMPTKNNKRTKRLNFDEKKKERKKRSQNSPYLFLFSHHHIIIKKIKYSQK